MRSRGGLAGVVGIVAVAAAAVGRAATPSLPEALLDARADRVHARTDVPSVARKVGEVRLVERGTATVVQTLLATRVVGRVVAEIQKKEAANWPPEAPGHDDMQAYVEALREVTAALERERDAAAAEDRRVRLAIEFVADAKFAGVAFVAFDANASGGVLEPRERRPLSTKALRRTYVLRNMRLILADAFAEPEATLERLGPLGPAAPEPVARPPAR